MLETIASDPGLQQVELVFLGLFGRACRILEAQNSAVRGWSPLPADPAQRGRCAEGWWSFVQELPEARQEAAQLVELLNVRTVELANTLDADFPDLRSSVWLSEAAAQSAVQSLTPQMTENRKRVSRAAS